MVGLRSPAPIPSAPPLVAASSSAWDRRAPPHTRSSADCAHTARLACALVVSAPPRAAAAAAAAADRRASASRGGEGRRMTRSAACESTPHAARGPRLDGVAGPGGTGPAHSSSSRQSDRNQPAAAGSPEQSRARRQERRRAADLRPHIRTEVPGQAVGVVSGRGCEQTGQRVVVRQEGTRRRLTLTVDGSLRTVAR